MDRLNLNCNTNCNTPTTTKHIHLTTEEETVENLSSLPAVDFGERSGISTLWRVFGSRTRSYEVLGISRLTHAFG